MRSLLIVTPHFPPINGADMHRVRTSLPHYAEFGWEPRVLTVEPREIEQPWHDEALIETVPADIPVRRVGALPIRWTRPLGLGGIGIRAWLHLHRAGCRWIREKRPDLVFISTTAFALMTLGRSWKKRFGIPYVLDMQDPWVRDEADGTEHRPGLKHRLMRELHRCMEPYAMRGADGLLAVSPAYVQTLRQRYPNLRSRPTAVFGFGVSRRDFELAALRPRDRSFPEGDGLLHGVSVGVVAPGMRLALRILFTALRAGLREDPAVFERVRLHFIGTSYAVGSEKVVTPLAVECGVGDRIIEATARVPYSAALQLQTDAAFIVIPGSEDAAYVPSKLFGSLFARRPVLALFHHRSPGVELFRQAGGGELVEFDPAAAAGAEDRALRAWQSLLDPARHWEPNWPALEAHEARPLARRQCELFDQVIAQHAAD